MKPLKQSIFTLAIALMAFTTNAQEDFAAKTKGSFLASGSISFNTTSSKQTLDEFSAKSTSSGLVAGPKAGYYVMDNLAIGLELEIGVSTQKEDEDKITSTRIGVGPFARYNLDNGLFGEVAGIIGSSKATATSGGFDLEEKTSAFGFKAGVGYSLFLGDHVAIEPAVFYALQTSKPKDAVVDVKTTLSTIFLNIGFTAYF